MCLRFQFCTYEWVCLHVLFSLKKNSNSLYPTVEPISLCVQQSTNYKDNLSYALLRFSWFVRLSYNKAGVSVPKFLARIALAG